MTITTQQRRAALIGTPLALSLAIVAGAASARDQSPRSAAAALAAAAEARQVRLALNEARDGADDPALWDRVDQFYADRAFQPIWVTPGRRDAAGVLLAAMARADTHGLSPAAYRVPRWRSVFFTAQAPSRQAWQTHADVQFTADVLRFATALATGSSGESAREIDVASLLEAATDAQSAAQVLDDLEPGHAGYQHLRRALARYRDLKANGGWPAVPSDILLRVDDGVEAVEANELRLEDAEAQPGPSLPHRGAYEVCRRLAVTGEIPAAACIAPAMRYDAALATAVRRFQSRQGLIIDGIVGPNTVAAMNVPVEARIAALTANMERWRQLPDTLGRRHVFVNIAGFMLEARVSGGPVLSMRVVAGEPETPTPVFSDEISYLEFRPYWNVPRSITVGELLPRIAREPGYLRSQGFEIVDGWDEPAAIIPPGAVDWNAPPHAFPYRLRQRPGPANSLGLVKFMFPNRYNVYLHDTPATHRFEARRRAFSHGCVRVEAPAALAAFLLDDPERWPVEAARAAMHGSGRQVVPLPTEVPVHLTYFTAWMQGSDVQFRRDIYGLDAAWLESREAAGRVGTLAAR